MNAGIATPNDFELELLEAQGGNISPDHFSQLLAQLTESCSLDHVSRSLLETTLGELDMVYVVLRKGYIYEFDENYVRKYTSVSKNDTDYWLAGLGSLRFPQAGYSDKNTADIVVSLLPRAQKLGCGRFLVQKLIQYAFDTLRIRRVTAQVVCPVQSYYTAARKKEVVLNTKQLCWMFEKFGFMFEGVTRGAIKSPTAKGEEPVWYDVHRMSMLDADYFEEGISYMFSNTCAFPGRQPRSITKRSPWESMIQRHEEERRDLESWTREPGEAALASDDFDDEGESDDNTVLGDDDDSDWEVPEDFDD
ncbi:unnamed protein product [Rhizoctonia solani]|uniref:N-acetyltransferase domain-containing protein n=1 Tax=Rhizoctonia solani TaxID=456999 RepID=A0A8H3CDC3_9AGAM|nr:unnamed protein product [Rhizoctonia solani]